MNVLDLFRSAIELVILFCAILILPNLVVGLVVSVFQAATQINEQTLSFVPRLITTFVTMLYSAPFILQKITSFTSDLFHNLGYWIN